MTYVLRDPVATSRPLRSSHQSLTKNPGSDCDPLLGMVAKHRNNIMKWALFLHTLELLCNEVLIF